MIHNDKNPKSPQNRLISFMERKSELLDAKNILFTSEDADDLLSWPDQQAEKVIAEILEEDFFWDPGICPWCLLYDLDCSICTFAKRHGRCEDILSSTYGKVLEQIPQTNFAYHLTPHKTELLALLSKEKEEQK